MNSDTKKVLDRQRKAAAADPVPLPSGELVMPTPQEMKDAKARRADAQRDGSDNLPPCHVVGLDYKKWASAIVDLDGSADRVASARRAYARKGYTLLRGSPIVVGFSNAEVWVKDRKLWLADREDRGRRIEDSVASGIMSDSAIAPSQLRGMRPARR
jgi:hypothetical protein